MGMGIPGSDRTAAAPASTLSDADVVKRVRAGEHALFEILMRRHNQQLYRAARAIVKDEHEVEDVMQQAYINAFTHLHQFEERSQFSTWLTRITLNEAFGRRRKMRQSESLASVPSDADEDAGEFMETVRTPQPDPERQAYAQELHRVLEEAVDTLPETYRAVFMLRDIEGLSTAETGDGLGSRRGSGQDAAAPRARDDSPGGDGAHRRHGGRRLPVPGSALRSRRRGGAGEDWPAGGAVISSREWARETSSPCSAARSASRSPPASTSTPPSRSSVWRRATAGSTFRRSTACSTTTGSSARRSPCTWSNSSPTRFRGSIRSGTRSTR